MRRRGRAIIFNWPQFSRSAPGHFLPHHLQPKHEASLRHLSPANHQISRKKFFYVFLIFIVDNFHLRRRKSFVSLRALFLRLILPCPAKCFFVLNFGLIRHEGEICSSYEIFSDMERVERQKARRSSWIIKNWLHIHTALWNYEALLIRKCFPPKISIKAMSRATVKPLSTQNQVSSS